jgi:DNA repair exonuclease SbcCD ATPase subunit
MVSIEYLQKTYSQMIAVSHIRDIKEMFDKKINIIKINGISEIKK